MVTDVPTTPHAGVNPVTVSAAAEAGSAVTSTPITPSTVASEVALFVGSLKEGSPFRAEETKGRRTQSPSVPVVVS
jgi:hypothetical protein